MTYAGFWRRLIAALIDYALVVVVTILFAIAFNSVFGELFTIRGPVDLGVKERVVLSEKTEVNKDGVKETVREFVETITAFDAFTYTYRGREWITSDSPWATYQRWQVDPQTMEPVVRYETNMLSFVVLLVYLTLMEASKRQASFGKYWMRMLVADEDGARLSIWHALKRNLGKLVSVALVGFGVFMIMWHGRKQGLHDWVFKTVVVDMRGPKALDYRAHVGGPDWAQKER